jgi:deoxyribonuclease V
MDEDELIAKYGIDIELIKKEQLKFAKEIKIKDSSDFSIASRIGAIENILVKNQIISVIVLCDKNFNLIEQQYFVDRLKFPYLQEFRSYRELPSMLEAFNKLGEKPDFIFIRGHGITHPRLGLASHFSVITNVPSIGVADNIFDCDKIEGDSIMKDNKKVGSLLQSKEGANPLYISPGSGLSLESAYKLAKNNIISPHKLPEPLHLAHKYAKSVQKELKL